MVVASSDPQFGVITSFTASIKSTSHSLTSISTLDHLPSMTSTGMLRSPLSKYNPIDSFSPALFQCAPPLPSPQPRHTPIPWRPRPTSSFRRACLTPPCSRASVTREPSNFCVGTSVGLCSILEHRGKTLPVRVWAAVSRENDGDDGPGALHQSR